MHFHFENLCGDCTLAVFNVQLGPCSRPSLPQVNLYPFTVWKKIEHKLIKNWRWEKPGNGASNIKCYPAEMLSD